VDEALATAKSSQPADRKAHATPSGRLSSLRVLGTFQSPVPVCRHPLLRSIKSNVTDRSC